MGHTRTPGAPPLLPVPAPLPPSCLPGAPPPLPVPAPPPPAPSRDSPSSCCQQLPFPLGVPHPRPPLPTPQGSPPHAASTTSSPQRLPSPHQQPPEAPSPRTEGWYRERAGGHAIQLAGPAADRVGHHGATGVGGNHGATVRGGYRDVALADEVVAPSLGDEQGAVEEEEGALVAHPAHPEGALQHQLPEGRQIRPLPVQQQGLDLLGRLWGRRPQVVLLSNQPHTPQICEGVSQPRCPQSWHHCWPWAPASTQPGHIPAPGHREAISVRAGTQGQDHLGAPRRPHPGPRAKGPLMWPGKRQRLGGAGYHLPRGHLGSARGSQPVPGSRSPDRGARHCLHAAGGGTHPHWCSPAAARRARVCASCR